MGPRGSQRDLWVDPTGPGKPAYGRWKSPSGLDVMTVLRQVGPRGLDVDVHWEQVKGSRGTRPTDLLWQTGLSGLKVASHRLAAMLGEHCPEIETLPVEVRLRGGATLDGYVGLLEPQDEPAPVHSLFRGRRGSRLVVTDEVAEALRGAGLTGLEVEPAPGPVPADRSDWCTD